MNKKINLVLIALIIPYGAQAANISAVTTLETIVKSKRINHKDTVILKDHQLIFNGEALTSTEAILKASTFKNIMTISQEKKQNSCSAGTYKHVVKKSHEPERGETGCLGSVRYEFLKINFQKLKKDMLIN